MVRVLRGGDGERLEHAGQARPDKFETDAWYPHSWLPWDEQDAWISLPESPLNPGGLFVAYLMTQAATDHKKGIEA